MRVFRFSWATHPPHTYKDQYRAVCLDRVRAHLRSLPPQYSQEQRAIEVAKEFDVAYNQSVAMCELVSRMELASLIDRMRAMNEQFERQLAG